MDLAAWQIRDGVPLRAASASIALEEDLRRWIEADPSLVGDGLSIVGREVGLGSAGRVDLLAVDPTGRWFVIEIKAGKLYRETVAQAVDYAAALAELAPDRLRAIAEDYCGSRGQELPDDSAFSDDLDIQMIVVGADTNAGLERVAAYLAKGGFPIRAVAFKVMEVDGDLILLRDVVDSPDADEERSSKRPNRTLDEVLALFDANGVGEAARELLTVAEELGLGQRVYKQCIMLTPANKKTVGLVTFGIWSGKPILYCWKSALTEQFDVTEAELTSAFGAERGLTLSLDTASLVSRGLRDLLTTS